MIYEEMKRSAALTHVLIIRPSHGNSTIDEMRGTPAITFGILIALIMGGMLPASTYG